MKKAAAFFGVLFLVAFLCYGIARLFQIRFAQGDVYAPYSTLRADGLGSKALHDSLAELMPVERNYHPLSELHPEDGSTIFVLGANYWFNESPEADDLETLARNGSRVVVAYLPYQSKPYEEPADEDDDKSDKENKKNEEKPSKKSEDKKANDKKTDEHSGLWAIKVEFSTTASDHVTAAIAGIEPELSWHSAIYFNGLDPAWRTLYSNAGKPVAIERAIGKGSVVLISDAYFSSNEALSKERAPELISMLVGNAGTVIFDETHLGIHENPGVASLVRKYRLHGVVLALMIVAALFVWRNAVSFVPPEQEELARQDIVRGTDAATGFVSLLKRNIPFNKLIGTCLAEWKRSFGHRAKPVVLARVESLVAGDTGKPVQTFQMITQILNEK